MTASPFKIEEHIIDTSYMREYPRGSSPQNAPLKLAIKKYTPADNLNPQLGDITLIGSHGCGFAKELYEPLWEEILARSKANGFRIRAIWTADAANQGVSGILNEEYLGNDPSWFDHSRDLLHMVNHFQNDMHQPIMGVGHSLGGAQLMFLSYLHPRLFLSLLTIEPFIWENDTGANNVLMALTAKKKDSWPNRAAAVEKASPLFKTWDPRVMERLAQYNYRELPTVVHPDTNAPGGVTLATTKHQELLTYLRPNYSQHRELGLPDSPESQKANGPAPPHDSLLVPDMIGDLYPGQVFYRAEPLIVWRGLPHLRPSALIIGGSKSDLMKWGLLEKAAKITGTGIGGSGGMRLQKVKYVVIPKSFHTVPMEKVAETADVLAPWISRELERWRGDERRVAEGWDELSSREKSILPKQYISAMFASIEEINKRNKASKL